MHGRSRVHDGRPIRTPPPPPRDINKSDGTSAPTHGGRCAKNARLYGYLWPAAAAARGRAGNIIRVRAARRVSRVRARVCRCTAAAHLYPVACSRVSVCAFCARVRVRVCVRVCAFLLCVVRASSLRASVTRSLRARIAATVVLPSAPPPSTTGRPRAPSPHSVYITRRRRPGVCARRPFPRPHRRRRRCTT